MTEFLQQLVNGLSIGSIYALITLEYAMVYGITKSINLAYGDIYTLGAYVGFISVMQLYLGFFPALLLTMVVCDVPGVIIERIAYKPLCNVTRIAASTTVADVSYFLEYSTWKIMGPGVKTYPSVLSNQTFHTFGIQIQIQQIYILTITITLMFVLQLIVCKMKIGRPIRAVSVDMDVVKLMGINVDTTIFYTFAIGSALAGAGGVLAGMYCNMINPLMGMVPGIKAFVTAVFGGIGITPGVMSGGFFIGIIEALVTTYGNSLYKNTVVYVILVLILITKSTGLLGKNVKEKVQAYETYL